MRRSSSLFVLFVALLFTLVACGTPSGGSDGGVSVRVSPSEVTLAPGEQQEFTVDVQGASDPSVSWDATEGSVDASGASATYTAPAEPGEYAVTATSVEDPSASASATVTVEAVGEARIEITSEDAILLTDEGESAQLQAVVYDESGHVDPDAAVEWVSSQPDDVSVTTDGQVTAEHEVGFATVTASHGDLPRAQASVAVAQPEADTRLIDEANVRGVAEDALSARLARTAETEALDEGDILVSRAGLLSRITSLQEGEDAIEVELEDATLDDAFERVVMRWSSEPIEYSASIRGASVQVTSTDAPELEQQLNLPDFECTTEAGDPIDVTFESPDIDIDYQPEPIFEYDSYTGVLEVGMRDAPTLDGSLGGVEASVGGEVSFACTHELREIAIPAATFFELVSISGDITPVIGVEAEITYDGPSVDVAGPSVQAGVEYAAGVRYDETIDGWAGTHWEPFGEAQRNFSASWGSVESDLTAELDLYAGPFVSAKLGLSARALRFSAAGVTVLEPKVSGGGHVNLPLADPYDIRYGGPRFDLRGALSTPVKLELKGLLARAFRYFGIDAGIDIADFELLSVERELSPRPSVYASSERVTDTVDLTASVDGPGAALANGGTIEFIGFHDGGTTASIIGDADLDDDGTATTTWTPTASDNGSIEVAALLFDPAFGTIGLPYRSTDTTTLDVAVGDTQPTQHTLDVSVTGSGTVTSDPAAIDCGSDCTAEFEEGETVTLIASPAEGWTSDGWTGDADCDDGSLEMTADRTCSATFVEVDSPTGVTSLSDDFDDGDYTSSPAWTIEFNDPEVAGTVTASGGYAHFVRTGAGGNGGGVGIGIPVDILVTDNTTVAFDAIANYRSVGDGCGWTCWEYPANVDLYLLDSAGTEYRLKYAINYGSAILDQTNGTIKQIATSIPQGVWERNLQFNVRQGWPDVVRITEVRVYGNGWDFDGGIDNIVISD